MSRPLDHLSARRAHLDVGSLLRTPTEVIDRVPNGINLGQLRAWNGLAVADDEVVVTAGSPSAFFAVGLALLDPNDESP